MWKLRAWRREGSEGVRELSTAGCVPYGGGRSRRGDPGAPSSAEVGVGTEVGGGCSRTVGSLLRLCKERRGQTLFVILCPSGERTQIWLFLKGQAYHLRIGSQDVPRFYSHAFLAGPKYSSSSLPLA